MGIFLCEFGVGSGEWGVWSGEFGVGSLEWGVWSGEFGVGGEGIRLRRILHPKEWENRRIGE